MFCLCCCAYQKCRYCHEIIKTSKYAYCNEICEFNDIFKDSFRTADSSECRYIYDLNI